MKFTGAGIKANIYQSADRNNRGAITSMKDKVQRWKIGRLVSC